MKHLLNSLTDFAMTAVLIGLLIVTLAIFALFAILLGLIKELVICINYLISEK